MGATLSLSVGGLTAGQTYYVKVDGVDATAFGTGAYALTLNFGTGPSPTVPLPDTQLLNGDPFQAGGGQGIKVDEETLVNTYTAGCSRRATRVPGRWRWTPTAIMSSRGRARARTASGWGVYAQRFDASGAQLGGEFRVNSATDGDQANAAVAMNDARRVRRRVGEQGARTASGWGVYARRFDASGAALGGEFRVNSATDGDQTNPSVAMGAVGELRGHLVELRPGRRGNPGGSTRSGSTPRGSRLGDEFRVNSATDGDQDEPERGDERRAASSSSPGRARARTASGWGVYAQRYDASGAARGASSASTPPPTATRRIRAWRSAPRGTS